MHLITPFRVKDLINIGYEVGKEEDCLLGQCVGGGLEIGVCVSRGAVRGIPGDEGAIFKLFEMSV